MKLTLKHKTAKAYKIFAIGVVLNCSSFQSNCTEAKYRNIETKEGAVALE